MTHPEGGVGGVSFVVVVVVSLSLKFSFLFFFLGGRFETLPIFRLH